MSLPHILLGLLSAPATGYELKKTFDQTLRHFWSAELSQIYPALQRLEAERLLRSAPAPSSRGPARRVYERTARGTRELRRWLEAPPEASNPRIGFLAQIFMMGELRDLETSRRFIQVLDDGFQASLRRLGALETAVFPDPRSLQDEEFHRYLTFSFGQHRMIAAAQWSHGVLEQIDERLAARREAE